MTIYSPPNDPVMRSVLDNINELIKLETLAIWTPISQGIIELNGILKILHCIENLKFDLVFSGQNLSKKNRNEGMDGSKCGIWR